MENTKVPDDYPLLKQWLATRPPPPKPSVSELSLRSLPIIGHTAELPSSPPVPPFKFPHTFPETLFSQIRARCPEQGAKALRGTTRTDSTICTQGKHGAYVCHYTHKHMEAERIESQVAFSAVEDTLQSMKQDSNLCTLKTVHENDHKRYISACLELTSDSTLCVSATLSREEKERIHVEEKMIFDPPLSGMRSRYNTIYFEPL